MIPAPLMALLIARFSIGFVAWCLMLLVTIGFRQSAHPRLLWLTLTGRYTPPPNERMRMSLSLYHLKGILRTGWWDVAAVFAVFMGWLEPQVVYFTSVINICFQIMNICGSLLALWALHGKIREPFRSHYNWLTAPFFPWSRLHTDATLRRALEVDEEMTEERHRMRNSRGMAVSFAKIVLRDPGINDTTREAATMFIEKQEPKD